MTQDTTQPESEQQETAAGDPICGQHHGHDSNHLRLSTNDSASDNDTGERPVREKLKKTSIASMPRDDAMAKSIDAKVEAILSTNSKEPREHNSSNDETPSPISEPRGRLSRKRSYDDSIETSSGAGRDSPEERPDDDDAKQARKRSRDIRALHSKTLESLTTPTNQWSPERELEGSKSGKDEALDQELEESAQSPRKKRSREDIDVDPQRGQKIAATEEAKAYRRSEDSERGHVPLQDDKGTFTVDSTVHEEQRPTSEESSASQQNQFPQAEIDPPEPASQRAPEAANVEEKAPQKAPTSFAASGFAAMSNSSESPFGTFGASTPSTFRPAPAPTSTTLGLARNNTVEPQTTQTTTSSAFGNSPSPFLTSTTASTGLTGFGFGANGAAPKPSGFGGSVFGSGFMNKGAAAPKLTSFAAPTGDLAPPKPAESIKALGTQGEDSADEEGGSDDEANPGEVGAAEVEVDSRFQQQEVETGEAGEQPIFTSSRAQLYFYDSGGWHEKGKGAFKLNVAETENEKKARFIMRAHQTYRVLLNQPVFKKMQVGGSKGQEPSGKHFSFAVIDEGRPTPHLLKLSDENESKALYREVLKLQQDMETQA